MIQNLYNTVLDVSNSLYLFHFQNLAFFKTSLQYNFRRKLWPDPLTELAKKYVTQLYCQNYYPVM